MKKYILSSLTITFLLLSITACSQGKQISGSSNYITKNIKVGSFDQIKSMSSSDIVYTQKLEIRVSSPSLKHLSIYGSGNTTFTNGIKSHDELQMSIYGSGNISGNSFSCTKLAARIYGSGNVNLKRISTSDTQVNISGSGNVLLDGKSTEAEYHIAGSGDINATELKVENVNARISGSGSIRCYATENLTGGVSGSGNVAYKGNPQINFSKRGLQKL